MKYGYFDNENREYVITNPATPAPWVNYLGSPEYGAIISNNAGGYSFAKSGANGRILRYVFNNFDQPGRYIYIRDDRSSDFWSASWQPAGKDLAQYKSECRHGIGYTKISADYSDIHSEALNASMLGAPENFRITVRELKVSAGAHFVAALTGSVLTMPGLPKVPAAEGIDVDDDGVITGLF